MPKIMRKMMDADAKTDANGEDAETVSVKRNEYLFFLNRSSATAAT